MEEVDKGWLMTTMGVSGRMFPGQSPDSHKTVVFVCVWRWILSSGWFKTLQFNDLQQTTTIRSTAASDI